MSLVSSQSPSQDRLDCAMGYENGEGCQDMFVNHPTLRGFANQVGNGAWQLRYNYEYALRGTKPGGFTQHYIVGESLQLPEESKYGGKLYDIVMSNAATAAAYSYTPYVFDSAYNLWMLFNNWFTATPDVTPPPTQNDTAAFNEKTYGETYTVSGSKSSDSKVYLGGQLIQNTGTTSWQITSPIGVGSNNLSIEYKDAAGTTVATKTITINRHRVADINGDGTVDIQDLSIISTYWGQNKPGEALADLNGDNIVDILDLSTMASNWNG